MIQSWQKIIIMAAKTIYIFRHGQTDYNATHRVMGQLDIPLNETGIQQAINLADKMLGADIRVIYSSPLSRAMQTAQIVADKIGVNIKPHNGLMERHNGKLQGHIVHVADTPEQYQTDYAQTELFLPAEQLKNDNWQPDGGESRTECFKRAQQTIMDIIKESPYDTIAISTHSGPMTGILNLVNGTSERIGNTDCIKLTFDGKKLER